MAGEKMTPSAEQRALADRLAAFREALAPGERACFDAILRHGVAGAAEVAGFDGGPMTQILPHIEQDNVLKRGATAGIVGLGTGGLLGGSVVGDPRR